MHAESRVEFENVPAYITPAQVARRLDTCVQTVHRWIKPGARLRDGSRLPLRADRLPGGWRTTKEWLDEFIGRLTADRTGSTAEPGIPRASARRQREIEAAERELAGAGFSP